MTRHALLLTLVALSAAAAGAWPRSVVAACSSGPCCQGGVYASSATQCDPKSYKTEQRCTSTYSCGGDVEVRYQYKYCSGSSSSCSTGNLKWTSWSKQIDCPSTQKCKESFSTATCTMASECEPKQCTSGACCDTKTWKYLPSATTCDATPYKTEYKCSSTSSCGGTLSVRQQMKHCSGSSTSCGTSNLLWTDWMTAVACDKTTKCKLASSSSGSCAAVPECAPKACTSGSCCDSFKGTYKSPAVQCSSAPYQTQYQCSGSGCGSDVQVRRQWRYCSGADASCGMQNLVWDGWQTAVDCFETQACDATSGFPACSAAGSCQGAGGCPADAACCDDGGPKPTGAQCAALPGSVAVKCDGAPCGGSALYRYQYAWCDGSSLTCPQGGPYHDSQWKVFMTCGSGEACKPTTLDGQPSAACEPTETCDADAIAPDTSVSSDDSVDSGEPTASDGAIAGVPDMQESVAVGDATDAKIEPKDLPKTFSVDFKAGAVEPQIIYIERDGGGCTTRSAGAPAPRWLGLALVLLCLLPARRSRA